MAKLLGETDVVHGDTEPLQHQHPTPCTHDCLQQLTTLLAVSGRLTRDLTLPNVLAEIATAAAAVLGGEAGFRLAEGTELVRTGATPGALAAMSRERLPIAGTFCGRVFTSGQLLTSCEASTDARILSAEHRTAMRAAHLASVLCVPLRADGIVVGTLHIFRERGYYFDQMACQLAQHLADQAGNAIENARLYQRLESHSQRLQTLTRLTQLISSSLHLHDVLYEIAEAAATLMETPLVRIWKADEETQTLTPCAASDTQMHADYALTQIRFGEQAAGWVARDRTVLHIPDVFTDARTPSKRWFQTHGLRSLLAVPISYRDTLLGVLVLMGRAPFHFSSDDQALLDSFVAQAAVAIHNATVYAAEAAARRAAEQTTRLKSEFLANVSHELRTPMNGILGMTRLTLDTPLTAEQQEYLSLMQTSADALLDILNDLLDFSKIEAGKLDLEAIPFHLHDIIGSTLKTLAWRAHDKGLALTCAIHPAVPPHPDW